MDTIHKLGALNLQRFAEGGAVGEGASVGDSQTGENSAEINSANPDAGENKQTANPDEELDRFFSENPDLKKANDKRTSKAVQGRVHQMKTANQKNEATLQKLMVRYGVDNIDALNEYLDSDDMFENLAAERGESPETLRELERLRVQEAIQKRSRAEYEREQAVNEQIQRWQDEADEIKKTYPGFDLETELQNPEFRSLITTKNPQYQISMEKAYRLIHHDELIKAAEDEAAAKFARSVNSRSSRPDENGLGNQSNVTMANDVHKLTKKDRAELAKRAARGEKIEF